MKTKHFFLTALTAGITAYVAIRLTRQLKLIYNYESGQLIIDRMRSIKCCHQVFIESLVVYLNGEAYKGYDYSENEKPFDNALFIEVPDLDEGDLIEVKMKTRCSRQMNKWGKLAIV